MFDYFSLLISIIQNKSIAATMLLLPQHKKKLKFPSKGSVNHQKPHPPPPQLEVKNVKVQEKFKTIRGPPGNP